MMAPTRIDATYRATTPMFCGGASGKHAELRLPSFKGVLRYWWRALAWSEFIGDLQKIAGEEDCLFGSAGGGQSRMSMRLASQSRTTRRRVGEQLPVGEGARYLGYGVMEAFASQKKGTRAGQLMRGCLDGCFDFTVQIRLRNQGGRQEGRLALLERAVKCVGFLGGIGAKSRKGYGSIVIRSLIVDGESRQIPRSMAELRGAIANLHGPHVAGRLPEYTAFSDKVRHLLVASEKKKPVELLDLLGREFVRFRSRGRNRRILGNVDSELIFEDDHNLMNAVANQQRPEKHPRRVSFGLPHNYGAKRHQQVSPQNLDRRASPLFVHIHECTEGPVAVLSFLPARFLPEGTAVNVGGYRVRPSPEKELYQPIHQFLDRMRNKGDGSAGQRKELFTTAKEVRP